MALRLKVTRYAATQVNFTYAGAIRNRIVVSDPSSSGADPYVFLFRRGPLNPHSQDTVDDFFAVCSPGDLAWPIGEPDPDAEYPFFRAREVELDFIGAGDAQEVWLIIVREIDTLLNAQIQLNELSVIEETWVGDGAPEGGGSDSASTSGG